MKQFSSFSELPSKPAVYALYGEREKRLYVAYVGQTSLLKTRILEHLVYRNSSITTGVNVVSLNPDCVTRIAWWEHPKFDKSYKLKAAELVAFDVFEPTLRSRGNIEKQANQLYKDENFNREMKALFESEPAGYLITPVLQNAFKRILELEKSLAVLQNRLEQIEKNMK